jgi:hypothetical protein
MYLDDSPQHVKGARELGFKAQQVLAIDDLPQMLGLA